MLELKVVLKTQVIISKVVNMAYVDHLSYTKTPIIAQSSSYVYIYTYILFALLVIAKNSTLSSFTSQTTFNSLLPRWL